MAEKKLQQIIHSKVVMGLVSVLIGILSYKQYYFSGTFLLLLWIHLVVTHTKGGDSQ